MNVNIKPGYFYCFYFRPGETDEGGLVVVCLPLTTLQSQSGQCGPVTTSQYQTTLTTGTKGSKIPTFSFQ